VDNIASAWRVYSPPGKNRSTTAALATLTVGGAHVAPILTNAFYANGQFSFLLLGEPNVTYVIEATSNFGTWIPVATNTAPTATRSITVNASSATSFFRARIGVSGPVGPVLSAPVYTGNQFQFTLTGASNATYVILVSTDLVNWSSVLTNTSANAVRPISIPATGPRNFYRALLIP